MVREFREFDIWGHPKNNFPHGNRMWLGHIEAISHRQVIKRAGRSDLFRGFTITNSRLRRGTF